MLLEGGYQRVDPARLHGRVVVEEQQEVALCFGRDVIAGADEAEVLFVADEAQALDLRSQFRGFIAAAVVDQDDLEGRFLADRGDGLEAKQGGVEVVVSRDHHADDGLVGGRQRERRKRRGFRYAGPGNVRLAVELLLQALDAATHAACLEAAQAAMAQVVDAATGKAQSRQQRAQLAPGEAQRPGQLPTGAVDDALALLIQRQRPCGTFVKLLLQLLVRLLQLIVVPVQHRVVSLRAPQLAGDGVALFHQLLGPTRLFGEAARQVGGPGGAAVELLPLRGNGIGQRAAFALSDKIGRQVVDVDRETWTATSASERCRRS